ncbi:MAG: LacI family transcriptional regulator [Firmicutes bacterium]|nr:LacI family transcriptional regulator [Bacillota bacterium]
MRVTINDVARRAGVSVRTVSRVLNNHPNVNRFTRERVLQAIKELNFVPNALARGLATQESRTIGVIIPDVANPYFAEVLRGIEDVASQANYHIFLCNTDEDPEREQHSIRLLRQRQVDGLILVSPRLSNQTAARIFRDDQRVVVVNRSWTHLGITSIVTNNREQGLQAADFLAASKPTCLAYLSGPVTSESNELRWLGFSERAAELKLEVMRITPSLHRIPTIKRGHEAMDELLASAALPVGVFCFNDLMAIGALDSIANHGLRVPEDVSIVGVDGIEMAGRVHPSLTTFVIPKIQVGNTAMQCLLDMFQEDSQPEEVVIPAVAVQRSSTGKASEFVSSHQRETSIRR